MSARLRLTRASPLTSVQDAGRFGMLVHGITASGPMDRASFAAAAFRLGGAGTTGIEFTAGGLALAVREGRVRVGFAGGTFRVLHNGRPLDWPGTAELGPGDTLDIATGPAGNYGYLRFDAEVDLPPVLGSRAASSRVGLGAGLLAAGDALDLVAADRLDPGAPPPPAETGPIRVLWGLHAGLFPRELRARFLAAELAVTARMDRMGVQLDDVEGVFAKAGSLSLVSDAIVPGDIQILGDGTPIVLMRDHQPTGGYPRIATVVSADLDRFAQMRPGTRLRLESVSLARAHALLRGRP